MEAFDLPYMLQSAGDAMVALMSIERLAYLWFGVIVGLAIGLIPGIGGLTGFALLVPFTYTMDPIAAFAMLLGMSAVTNTSDTIPAILFGVPGTSSAQATVLDGLQMTRKGEAGRALAASYMSSLLGGVFGALILAISIPVVRPFVLAIGTPELLALTIFGIAMVASLSGNTPLRGLVAACFGILVSMVGTDVQTGTLRWAGDVLYLWDGVPMLPVLLGLFALPELCDLAVERKSVAKDLKFDVWQGMSRGIRDAFTHWYLIIRCSALGAVLGALPGITGAVTDWIVYAHALRSEKGAKETFTKGDVRGVIAPESANNANNGGSLLPTVAFGVPGSAGQAILLGAMMVHGFVPGPGMLTEHLDFTYTLAWSIALANILGAGICFMLSGQFAKVSTLRYTLILPAITAVVYVGAFQGSRSWGDLYALLIFGVIGWIMKRLRWPRPPVILGLVLGVLIERYMAISILRYEAEWLLRPGVLVLLFFAALAIMRPLINEFRHSGVKAIVPERAVPTFRLEDLLYVGFVGISAYMLIAAQDWPFSARIGPTVVGATAVIAGTISLIFVVFADRTPRKRELMTHRGIHMDLESEEGMSPGTVAWRGLQFFGWFVAFMVTMAFIGLIPAVVVMVIAYMRAEGNEPWRLCLVYAAAVALFIYIVFDQTIHIPWPPTILGYYFPILEEFIPSM